MDTSVVQRLNSALKQLGISKKSFAENVGIPVSTVTSALAMGKNEISSSILRVASTHYSINPEWLLTGEGEMLKKKDVDMEENPQEEIFPDDFTPLVPTSAFAGGAVAVNEPVMLEQCARLPISRQGQPWEMAITVNGDSMEPQIPNGAILLISKVRAKWAVPYGNLAVVSTVDGAYIKEIAEGDEDILIARSYNPRYPDMRIPHADILAVYRVHAMFRHF